MMCHREIQLGGWHWHKLLCIPIDIGNNMSVYHITEPAIHKLERFPNIIEFIRSIHIIDNDKIGQSPAKFDNLIDNLFKVVCGMNVHKGSKFLSATCDPTQLQPIRVRPFMMSTCVIPCCKSIPIKHSVRAQDDFFSGFNRLIGNFIKNLLIIHILLMNL